MDKKIQQRLAILEAGDQLDANIKQVVIDGIKLIEDKFDILINEENGSMLVTHLAMALMRIKRGEDVEGLSEVALEEVRSQPHYDWCLEFCQWLEEQANLDIPEGEKGYIALHICSLLKE